MEPLAIYEMVIAVVLLFAKARIPEGSLYRWNPDWGIQRKEILRSGWLHSLAMEPGGKATINALKYEGGLAPGSR